MKKLITLFGLFCAGVGLQASPSDPKQTLSATAQTTETGFVQYFPDTHSLHAWRAIAVGDEQRIVIDLPKQQTLSRTQAIDFRRRLDRIHIETAASLRSFREERIALIAQQAPKFEPIPPILRQSRSADCRAPDYIENRLQFLMQPPTPSFVARIKTRECSADRQFGAGGTDVQIAPHWILTAAHVLTTDGAPDPCNYWIVPGAGAYHLPGTHPYGQSVAQIAFVPDPKLHVLVDLDAIDASNFAARVNADWALLQISQPQPEAALRHWPLLRFTDLPSDSNQVIKTGFPRGNRTRAFRDPGASLSTQALHICRTATGPELFAINVDFGDSGAPIWILPQQHANGWLEVKSIVSVGEYQGLVPRAYGPKFSLTMYRALVSKLSATRN